MKRYRKVNYTVKHNRRKTLLKDGTAVIHIMLTQKGTPARYKSLNIYIEPKYWDKLKHEVKSIHPNHNVYNTIILDNLKMMRQYENTIINRFGSCHVDRVKNEYDKSPDLPPTTFTDFCKRELNITKAKHSLDTFLSHRRALKDLSIFSKTTYWEDLTYDFIERFEAFLKRRKLENSTVNKKMDVIKTYTGKAIKKKFITINDNPFLGYKSLKEKEPDREYLTREELAKLEALTFDEKEKALERKRDLFLLLIYTGMRFGEMKALSINANIEETKDGLIIKHRTEKGMKWSVIPLHNLFKENGAGSSKPERLLKKLMERHLEKYKNFENAKDIPFSKISIQKFNDGLKLLARRVGSKKKWSSHAGRRTFATILDTLGLQQNSIQRLLRHSSPDMTAIYIQLTDRVVNEKLRQLEW